MLRKSVFTGFVALFALLALAACQAAPSQKIATGSTLLTQEFDDATSWESFTQGAAILGVENGAYRLQNDDSGIIWGLNDQSHTNVVIEVQTTQASDAADNAYGVMCRANTQNNGEGYYFFISGDGYYSIQKRVGTTQTLTPLVDWSRSGSVNQGKATNKIRAVCVNDYLALFVNDTFVGEAHDTSFTQGYDGLAGTGHKGGTIDVSFDHLTVKEGSIAAS